MPESSARIALEIAHAFGIEVNKDIVLAKYLQPRSGNDGPSWLTFIGQTKDSLWSVDFFRCESILLKSHWVMVVMDVFTRRIIGFAVDAADIDGITACRMFNHAISKHPPPVTSAQKRTISNASCGLIFEIARDRLRPYIGTGFVSDQTGRRKSEGRKRRAGGDKTW